MSEAVKGYHRQRFSAGLGFHIRAVHKALSRRLADALAEQGVALKHYYYLRPLYEEDDISQVELSARVGMERATVTRVLDTMERAGLVRRVRDRHDRRKINVRLTARAKKLRGPVLQTIERLNREALRGRSAREFAAFRNMARAIVANLGGSLEDEDGPS